MADPELSYRGTRGTGRDQVEESDEARVAREEKEAYEAQFTTAAGSSKTRPKAMFRGLESPIFPIPRPRK